jgi:hypothetical protein
MGSGLFYWSWIRKPTVIEPSLLLEQVEQHSTIAVAIHVGPTCQLGWGLIKVGFKYDNKSWVMCHNLSNAVFLHLRESMPFLYLLFSFLLNIRALTSFDQAAVVFLPNSAFVLQPSIGNKKKKLYQYRSLRQ